MYATVEAGQKQYLEADKWRGLAVIVSMEVDRPGGQVHAIALLLITSLLLVGVLWRRWLRQATMALSQEPGTAPPADEWFPLVLGASVADPDAPRYYSLRYDFLPASIDNSRPGTLHKGGENKVSVEFHNNQPGKPKVQFQGNSEDCKDIDAVIFFNGKEFRLERLHRAIKPLRHVREPGESAAATTTAGPGPSSSGATASAVAAPAPSGLVEKILPAPVAEPRSAAVELRASPVHVAPKETGKKKPAPKKEPRKKGTKRNLDVKAKGGASAPASAPPSASLPVTVAAPAASPVEEQQEILSSPTLVDIDDDEDDGAKTKKLKVAEDTIDDIVDIEEVVEEIADHESDYEIEDVEVSEEEDGEEEKAGGDGAVVVASQANTGDQPQSSGGSSSSSSGSSDSGSSSESGSDDEDDSASSGDDS